MKVIDEQFRLMNLMDLRAIYPMKSISKGGWMKYRMPYLLRNLLIDRPNQVWCTDITYVAMEHGFMYIYAIIDVYSRYIVGWCLYNSLDASNAIEVLDAAVRRHGAPEIINSDQGIDSVWCCYGGLRLCKTSALIPDSDASRELCSGLGDCFQQRNGQAHFLHSRVCRHIFRKCGSHPQARR